MKAWRVRKEGRFWATVVFAETRGKARAIARHTDACEDCDFCDMRFIDCHKPINTIKTAKWKWIGIIHKTELLLSKIAVLFAKR